MATTTAWDPKRCAIRVIRAGACRAGEFTATCTRGGVGPASPIPRHLVGPRIEDRSCVLKTPNASAHCERDKQFLGGSPYAFDQDRAVIGGGCDVEEDDLVCALL